MANLVRQLSPWAQIIGGFLLVLPTFSAGILGGAGSIVNLIAGILLLVTGFMSFRQ